MFTMFTMFAMFTTIAIAIVVIIIIIISTEDRYAFTVVVSAVSSMASATSVPAMMMAAFFIVVPSMLKTSQLCVLQYQRGNTHASDLIVNLLLITSIAGCEIDSASIHATSLPFILWIAHDVTEDTVTAGLIELTTLLVAAALGVLALVTITVGSENALLFEKEVSATATGYID